MAFFAQEGSGQSGFITSGLAPFANVISGQQGQLPLPGAGSQVSVWDILMQHFAYTYPADVRTPASRATDFIGRAPTPPRGIRAPGLRGGAPRPYLDQPERMGMKRVQDEQRRMRTDRARLARLAREAGLDPSDSVQLAEFWMSAVQEAEAAYAVDPRENEIDLVWEVLERWARDGAPGTFKAEDTLERRRREWYDEQDAEPYEVSRTDTSVQITDPDTARELAKEAWRRRFGREPSDEEMRTFVSSLTAHERANPTRTTTVTQYGADGRVLGTESSTEGGGVSPGAFAMSFDEEENEGEERAARAGIEYAGVIDQLVGGF